MNNRKIKLIAYIYIHFSLSLVEKSPRRSHLPANRESTSKQRTASTFTTSNGSSIVLGTQDNMTTYRYNGYSHTSLEAIPIYLLYNISTICAIYICRPYLLPIFYYIIHTHTMRKHSDYITMYIN